MLTTPILKKVLACQRVPHVLPEVFGQPVDFLLVKIFESLGLGHSPKLR